MAEEHEHEHEPIEPQDVLRLLEDVRSRLRIAVWALHGMHQDMAALCVDDITDLEHLVTETVDHVLAPAYDAVSQMVGTGQGGGPDTRH